MLPASAPTSSDVPPPGGDRRPATSAPGARISLSPTPPRPVAEVLEPTPTSSPLRQSSAERGATLLADLLPRSSLVAADPRLQAMAAPMMVPARTRPSVRARTSQGRDDRSYHGRTPAGVTTARPGRPRTGSCTARSPSRQAALYSFAGGNGARLTRERRHATSVPFRPGGHRPALRRRVARQVDTTSAFPPPTAAAGTAEKSDIPPRACQSSPSRMRACRATSRPMTSAPVSSGDLRHVDADAGRPAASTATRAPWREAGAPRPRAPLAPAWRSRPGCSSARTGSIPGGHRGVHRLEHRVLGVSRR